MLGGAKTPSTISNCSLPRDESWEFQRYKKSRANNENSENTLLPPYPPAGLKDGSRCVAQGKRGATTGTTTLYKCAPQHVPEPLFPTGPTGVGASRPVT